MSLWASPFIEGLLWSLTNVVQVNKWLDHSLSMLFDLLDYFIVCKFALFISSLSLGGYLIQNFSIVLSEQYFAHSV